VILKQLRLHMNNANSQIIGDQFKLQSPLLISA